MFLFIYITWISLKGRYFCFKNFQMKFRSSFPWQTSLQQPLSQKDFRQLSFLTLVLNWNEIFYSLLVTRSFLLVTCYFLLVTSCFLLVTRYFLLVTCRYLLVTRSYLLGTQYVLFVQYCIILIMFILYYTSVPEKENRSPNGCFSFVGRYCLLWWRITLRGKCPYF